MAREGSIAIPTGGNIGRSLQNYGIGLVAGIGFRVVSGFTGSGLIGGAIAAAVTGAIVPGKAGDVISISLGFQQGQLGLGALGLGGGFGGLLGGGGGGGGDQGIAVI